MDPHMSTNMYMTVEKLAFTLEERVMSLISTTEKTCVWCVAITIAALTLLAVTWMAILFNYSGTLGAIKVIFPD